LCKEETGTQYFVLTKKTLWHEEVDSQRAGGSAVWNKIKTPVYLIKSASRIPEL
jgi:hypothetical protein